LAILSVAAPAEQAAPANEPNKTQNEVVETIALSDAVFGVAIVNVARTLGDGEPEAVELNAAESEARAGVDFAPVLQPEPAPAAAEGQDPSVEAREGVSQAEPYFVAAFLGRGQEDPEVPIPEP
jgi:hypothetical protein